MQCHTKLLEISLLFFCHNNIYSNNAHTMDIQIWVQIQMSFENNWILGYPFPMICRLIVVRSVSGSFWNFINCFSCVYCVMIVLIWTLQYQFLVSKRILAKLGATLVRSYWIPMAVSPDWRSWLAWLTNHNVVLHPVVPLFPHCVRSFLNVYVAMIPDF